MNLARRAATALLVAVTVSSALTGCSGDKESVKDNPDLEGDSPEDVLALAKETLDETPGLQIKIVTEDLPEDAVGFTEAEGTATHQPAFDGTVTISGAAIPVVAVDGKVYANVLGGGFDTIDPASLNAPDPAALITPDNGFSKILANTSDLKEGDTVRGGDNNDETLVQYTGTVPGDVANSIIPSASGDFDATYEIAENGEVRSVELTGQFYLNSDPNTYQLTFTDYGTDAEIKAP